MSERDSERERGKGGEVGATEWQSKGWQERRERVGGKKNKARENVISRSVRDSKKTLSDND